MNPLIERLPSHLKAFIVPQEYHLYNAQNQAVWRYVMRMNIHFLKERAHHSYLQGLEQTGISLDHIPSMDEMNEKLAQIGWAAVAVDGFIPPNAFMEFQAHQVLVIAADIRTLEHIEYTPAPDIIHEAAGHAPIIANPEYAEYLRRFGAIGSKAITSAYDDEVYEAIRHLSILKEDPHSNLNDIEKAESKVLELQNRETQLSEMAQIRNLHWWTVEYGLIGSIEQPKIYGAGLLSSIGESESCLKPEVKKVPYNVEAAHQNFDITKPQPQLYVTPDFAHLSLVLEEFANTMALRKGGLNGLHKLIDSRALGTIELSTGLQISGTFTHVIGNDDGKVLYVQTTGPTALAFREKELISHGVDYHREGFGSPIGKLKGINLAIEDMSPSDLEAYGIYEGKTVQLAFEGGVIVSGNIITGIRNLQGKILLISLEHCTVTYLDQVLFQPEWGIYDMAVGKKVCAAYAGAADVHSFESTRKTPLEKTNRIKYTEGEMRLQELYAQVRNLRESPSVSVKKLENIFQECTQSYPDDWLLILEIAEMVPLSQWRDQILQHLDTLKTDAAKNRLIENGLKLLANAHPTFAKSNVSG